MFLLMFFLFFCESSCSENLSQIQSFIWMIFWWVKKTRFGVQQPGMLKKPGYNKGLVTRLSLRWWCHPTFVTMADGETARSYWWVMIWRFWRAKAMSRCTRSDPTVWSVFTVNLFCPFNDLSLIRQASHEIYEEIQDMKWIDSWWYM